MFHARCGESVKLTNDNKTASRNLAEFNYGLVFSNEPLIDDELFEIRIDKKVSNYTSKNNSNQLFDILSNVCRLN